MLKKPVKLMTRGILDPGAVLDPDDPDLFDHFLRTEMERPCNKWMMVSLLSSPKVKWLPIEDTESVEGVLY